MLINWLAIYSKDHQTQTKKKIRYFQMVTEIVCCSSSSSYRYDCTDDQIYHFDNNEL
mgnify:CR=1 FL=1